MPKGIVSYYNRLVPQLDGLSLVYTVTDLSELLNRGSSIDDFLSNLVETVKDHMGAAVCSIYLYDVELDQLVLRGTTGLNRELVGHVRLKRGEGLTGYAFQQNTAVIEHDVTQAQQNKAIPDLGEEQFPAFVGVPIKRNSLGIGVLTLQYTSITDVEPRVSRALGAIASHLATTLESAAALYEFHESPASIPSEAQGPVESGLIVGTSASRGVAIGTLEYLEYQTESQPLREHRSLNDAIGRSRDQLQDLQRRVDKTLSDVAAMIFSSHLLMLSDDSFVGEMSRRAETTGSAIEAVRSVVDLFCKRFSAIPDPRFQEKAQDVQDLGNRIIHNIVNLTDEEGDYHGHVVVAKEIFPSELVKLYLQNVEGVVFSGGGATGHVSILAQSLDLPVVATADPRLFSIPSGTELVVDAEEGKIIVAPQPNVRPIYQERVNQRTDVSEVQTPIPDLVRTKDGTVITIHANVNLVRDAIIAHRIGATGIGLYRSEIPFLIRNGFPTEEEQYAVYRRVVQAMPGMTTKFRTLDLGGDKLLSTQVGREDNPFLGYRGIRFLLGHREIFRDQLRAMLRAGADSPIGIQFPMIGSMEEFLAAREEVTACVAELQRAGIPCATNPGVGAMIELPSAVEITGELARSADFLSIGSNDLTMYMLAADRNNHRVAEIYRRIHPAVLRVLKRVRDAAFEADTPLSVCGANVADPAMTLFYIGIGIRDLSVDPSRLHRVTAVIQDQDIEEAQTIAAAMLAMGSRESLQRLADEIRDRNQYH